MAQHFYDGQIRRYLTQVIRLLSNFSYKTNDNQYTNIPVMYGDISRQVAQIIRENSENKLPSCPRIAVYVAGLELDKQRLADSTFVSKLHIKERKYDNETNEYLNYSGKGYTVERLMPTPYNLTLTVDIWSSNTDQKLQILEQLLVLFNPSLEIQTSDNFVDWTSLSVVYLESVNWSNRSIGSSTESEIDIATLSLSTPIFITPPAKVKKLGVITSIITSIFNEEKGTVDLDLAQPVLQAYTDYKLEINLAESPTIDNLGNVTHTKSTTVTKEAADSIVQTSPGEFGLLISANNARLLKNMKSKGSWLSYLKLSSQPYQEGITELRLSRNNFNGEIIGTISLSTEDESLLIVDWDIDTIPNDTLLVSSYQNKSKVDYIIDPLKTNPTNIKYPGLRLLLIDESLGHQNNNDGPDGWKNNDNSDFIAGVNDIIEWNGSEWTIVFDASESIDQVIYTTNLFTNIQYKFIDGEWLLSFEGEYPQGSWRLVF